MLRRDLIDGVLAGFLVSIGGAVLLSCDNRYAGAFLFCIALLTICWFGFNLYTGKVGFLAKDHSKAALSTASAAKTPLLTMSSAALWMAVPQDVPPGLF